MQNNKCKKVNETLYGSVKVDRPIDDPKQRARESIRKKMMEELE